MSSQRRGGRIRPHQRDADDNGVILGAVAESLDGPEDLNTMDNGCVCCNVRGGLVRVLGQLTKRAMGLADPAPIVYTIQTNSKMSETYFIDSIVCLADCKHLGLQLDEVPNTS